MNPTTPSLRGRDLISPTIAALISVIVNYGGTFILVFQAAKVAGLSPEMTASWIWSISIGVGVTGIWAFYCSLAFRPLEERKLTHCLSLYYLARISC
ncbi:benzoate/H(+) symporter BenE family transporter [Paenibacillus sp. MER TA 81-3]|nr:benzoate/H(+) symporter BenE family transporter [Paenibacillus sp. MER TA 81-3]